MTEAEAFALLGLKPGSSPTRVDNRYKELVWEAHPDRGGEAGAFAALGEARTIAKAAAETWPCERCKGTGKLSLRASFGSSATLRCGHCGGTGKKW